MDISARNVSPILFLIAMQAAGQYTPPRTPDGQPDFQGVWSTASFIPLERPVALGAKEFYTEEELKENAKKAQQVVGVEVLGGTKAHYDFVQYGLDVTQSKHAPTSRTSLIFDPPNGRVPPMLPEARQRAAERAEARKRGEQFDGPETRSLRERCIMMGTEGPPMMPEAYNSNIQIQQGPGYVVILLEEIHDARIIPLDGRPHVSSNVRQLMGDPRGHWEGDTLVVDSTNFTNRTNFRGSTENLRVVERFTRVDADTILYRFTVEDPSTWARSWTGEMPFAKIPGPLYEFACHEGNYSLANLLSGARAAEKK
jgi:hypothetical protein